MKLKAVVLIVAGSLIIFGACGTSNPSTTPSTPSATHSGNAPSSRSGASTHSANTTHPPTDDVAIATCTSDSDVGSATAGLTVTNHSSKRSNYIIDVEFDDSGGAQLGSGTGVANDVDSGQVARVQALDFVTGSVSRCVVKNVERFAT